MNICCVGTGYVGLVTGVCFAELGNTVWCVDIDDSKIANLNKGIVTLYEPGLDALIAKNCQANRLRFTTDLRSAINHVQFCFITVGTPPQQDGSADLTQVISVAQDIGRYMEHYLVVVNKSTVPVGTAKQVKQIINQELMNRNKSHLEFDVVSNPEFLKEGDAVQDFFNPDRVVIGTDNSRAAAWMEELYKPISQKQHPILFMDSPSAELTKYAANCMLALRVSFINEMAQLCDKIGADISNIRLGIGTDRRIGGDFLNAGIGYGGSCFPKDIKELINTGRKHGLEMTIVSAGENVNEIQKIYLVDMIRRRFGNTLTGKKFAVWGLAFKPETDDMREAPSITIIQSLIRMGATVAAYDPYAIPQAHEFLVNEAENISYKTDMLDVLPNADALILATEWQHFYNPDFQQIKDLLRQPIIFDGRNQYNPKHLSALGFEYYCIGRGCYV